MTSELSNTKFTEPAKWRSAARTHTGNVRKVNEDSILEKPESGLWVVADGMGGHAAGDVASQMLVNKLQEIPDDFGTLSNFVNGIEDLILEVNDLIRERSVAEFSGKTMGCTVVTLLIKGDVGVCLWAGDSRLYRLRGRELESISSDHSQVNEMIEKGLLQPDEARAHPRSNVITRAVGAARKLFLDVSLMEVCAGDRYLLCSDGLYGELEDEQIRDTMLVSQCVEKCVDSLVSIVLEGPAKDNLSVVLVEV